MFTFFIYYSIIIIGESMEKSNKRRITIYVVFVVLSTLASIVGLISYLNGNGKKGASRQELVPLVAALENSSKYIELKNSSFELSTKLDLNGKIVVTYITSNKVLHTYNFVYSEENGNEILTCEYKYEDTAAVNIMKLMIDTIYIINGGTDSVFDHYPYETFTRTTIEQGIHIDGGNTVTLKINLKQNIVKNIDGITLVEVAEPYVIPSDLNNMMNELRDKSSFTISKYPIKIYVVDLGYSYNIYAENQSTSDNDDLYNSLMNVIKVLSDEKYNIIVNNKDKLNKNTKNNDYEVIIRAKLTNRNAIFNPKSDLLEVIIYK